MEALDLWRVPDPNRHFVYLDATDLPPVLRCNRCPQWLQPLPAVGAGTETIAAAAEEHRREVGASTEENPNA
jgi:hypothetical protein